MCYVNFSIITTKLSSVLIVVKKYLKLADPPCKKTMEDCGADTAVAGLSTDVQMYCKCTTVPAGGAGRMLDRDLNASTEDKSTEHVSRLGTEEN